MNDAKKQYSIVIPTMWYSRKTLKALLIYDKSEYIKEIILIDNNPGSKPVLSGIRKLRYYTRGHNIFVNAAWNWGASLANYELLICNDDLIFNNFDEVMSLISKSDFDIIGINVSKSEKPTQLEPIYDFPSKSYGCFLYVKNYVYIPEQFKIWFGDNFLFRFNKNRGILRYLNLFFEKSTTVDSDPSFRQFICKNSTRMYNQWMNPSNTDFNIIIRTSGRPNYFKNCIESIKRHYTYAKLHIIIDHIEDLEYVKLSAHDFDYNYYLVNQETVKNFCDKIKITRRQFIFNYYFNIVKPFLKGWCMFLDDDDLLMLRPDFTPNRNNIYLYKIKIGERIVPGEENFGKQPVLNDISGISIIFHSTQMVDWTPQRGGDFEFITAMFKKCNPIKVNLILSKTQTIGNFGKRNDLNKKVNKLAICIPIWKRLEVTGFVLNYYHALKHDLQNEVELILIACGSEGDISRKLAEENGFIYIEYANNMPQKHNALYLKAKEYDPDACLKIDSDSILSAKIFRYYNQLIHDEYDYSGITDIYFLIKDYLCHWGGYINHRTGEPTGVGRFLSRKLLNMLNWTPWGNSSDQFVDRVLTHNIAPFQHAIKMTKTSCKELNALCIDIKSEVQLTGFQEFVYDEVIPLNGLKIEY
jgi:hypothetical protein